MPKKEKTEFAKTILTIKAVVVGKDNKILLLKRGKNNPTNASKWDLPGGHLEKEETIEKALKRELLEETGLKVEMGKILGVVEFSEDSPRFKEEKRGLCYLAYCQEDEVEISAEHQKYQWFSFEEALNKLSVKDGFEKEKKETIKKAQKALALNSAMSGWQRALADLENYKKRSVKENESFKDYCLEDYVLGLLPVLDNFELALQCVPEEESENNWIVGILHIKKQLENFLTENGVNVIEAKPGDDFDESVHEALEASKKDIKKALKIKSVVKKGYKIKDRIIRPVVVKL